MDYKSYVVSLERDCVEAIMLIGIVGSDSAKELIVHELRARNCKIHCYQSARDIIASSASDEPACIVLLDSTTIDPIKEIRERFAATPLIVVHSEDAALAANLTKMAGVNVFCRPYFLNDLLASIKVSAMKCDLRVPSFGQTHNLGSRFRLLSSRECEVLELVTQGLLSKQIADVLSLSVRTVEAHRANILRKTNARNTGELSRLYTSYQAVLANKAT